jgi:hypothetical protein
MIITLVCLALSILLVLNVRASKLVMSEEASTKTRIFQLLFVWLLPFVGAIFVDGIHRGSGSSKGGYEPPDPGDDFGMSGQNVQVVHHSLSAD